jgi:hypothetical protein
MRLQLPRFFEGVCSVHCRRGPLLHLLSLCHGQPRPARATGVFDYLAKPFKLGQLVERVRAALGAKDEPAAPVDPGPESMII